MTAEGEGVVMTEEMVTITQGGSYLLSGNWEEGQVVIDLVDETEKVQLYLDDVSIHCSHGAAIEVITADKVFITLGEGTENTISATIPEGNSVDGGIFSKSDLTFNGDGLLTLEVKNGDGIVGKDELTITSGHFHITAEGHGMDSNDGIAIADGNFQITAGKDGLHASHSTKEEKGYIYILSGNFTIDAQQDGLDSGSFLEIVDGIFDISTGGGWESAPVKVATPNPMAEMMMGNMDSMGDMSDMMKEKMMGQGSSMNREEMMGQMGGSQEGMTSQMDGMNPTMDGFSMDGMTSPFSMLPDLSDLPDDFDFSNPDPAMIEEMLSSLPEEIQEMMSPMIEMMTGKGAASSSEEDKEPSRKGMKSQGDFHIYGGEFTIDSYDDGIHSDKNMVIYQGMFEIGTGDDGIHANWNLDIHDGVFRIYHCYEGLEGQQVHILGGEFDIISGDDGINAASNDRNPEDSVISLTISGGKIGIDSSAEGDGLDSNDSIYIHGGEIVISSTTESMDTTLGFFKEAVITGGTFLATGADTMTLRNFTGESTQGSIVVTIDDFQEDAVILTDDQGHVLVSFQPVKEYNAITISTPEMIQGETYHLRAGDFEESIFMETLQYGDGVMGAMMGGRR